MLSSQKGIFKKVSQHEREPCHQNFTTTHSRHQDSKNASGKPQQHPSPGNNPVPADAEQPAAAPAGHPEEPGADPSETHTQQPAVVAASQVVQTEPEGKPLPPSLKMKQYLENQKKTKQVFKHDVLDESTRLQDTFFNKALADAADKAKPPAPVPTPARANTGPAAVADAANVPAQPPQPMNLEPADQMPQAVAAESQTLAVPSLPEASEKNNEPTAGSYSVNAAAPQKLQQDANDQCCLVEVFGELVCVKR